jgi:aspartyl-tRNA(Asn)/glutamyl-tRNA(Gln) amidotransferase subunit B
MNYIPTVGLEVHVELKTKSKMFCGCKNDPLEEKPNVNICPICTGQPGTLPVINKEAVKKVIKTGLALNCEILKESKFDRKNYFYPDLPKGYQISQYDLPLCKEGFLEIGDKKIRVTRVHLEEDTGKLVHPKGADYSLVDFNRAGIPLMELVTEPDINSAKEAKKFAQELRLILKYLNVSEADMEKGQMRIEANISLQPLMLNTKRQMSKLGTKVEIKNLNSFRAVEKAIEYEIKRQAEILESGKEVIQETRGWDDAEEITVSQREKEKAHDYRYFPEPDLPPLSISKEDIQKIQTEIPELPWAKRIRFKEEYHLKDKEIEIFVFNKDLGEYFEKVVTETREWLKESKREKEIDKETYQKIIQLVANYLLSDLLGLLKGREFRESEILITPENFAEFISLIYQKKISSKIAKILLLEMFKTGADPSHIIEEKGLVQITSEDQLEKIIKEVVLQNQKAVKDYKSGKENALQFLIGKIMAETKGRAEPKATRELLTKILNSI